ncbi:MAG: hypothetical protein U0840_16070 [Gemmataceae bacterium]
MAQSRTESTRWTNPDVRFERTDVEFQGIVIFGIVLTVTTALSLVAMIWLGNALLRQEAALKVTDLPPAAVDADRLPPEPRLEALEDIRLKKVALFPPRAAEYYADQQHLLEHGDAARKIEPIQQAMAQVTRLAAKKEEKATPPATFSPRLPSKAAAGREDTGGW